MSDKSKKQKTPNIKFDDDQLKQLVDTITDNVIDKVKGLRTDEAAEAARKAAEKEAAKKVGKKTKTKAKTKPGQFDAAELAQEVAKLLQDTSKENADQLYATMFKEKVIAVAASIPGFDEFLDGDDDFGKKRRDRLDEIEDYDKRVSTLNALAGSYKEAMAGNGGKPPVVDKKMQEKAQENEAAYDKINDKLDKGEYANIGEFTTDFMKVLSDEAGSIMN